MPVVEGFGFAPTTPIAAESTTFSRQDAVATDGVARLSWARRVIAYEPTFVGAPLIVPVAPFIVTPAGSTPDVIDHDVSPTP